MREYKGLDNYGKPKSEYVESLQNAPLDELKKKTEQMIWLSAYASNNSRSDYHWQVDACYDVLEERTGDHKAYSECWQNVAGTL